MASKLRHYPLHHLTHSRWPRHFRRRISNFRITFENSRTNWKRCRPKFIGLPLACCHPMHHLQGHSLIFAWSVVAIPVRACLVAYVLTLSVIVSPWESSMAFHSWSSDSINDCSLYGSSTHHIQVQYMMLSSTATAIPTDRISTSNICQQFLFHTIKLIHVLLTTLLEVLSGISPSPVPYHTLALTSHQWVLELICGHCYNSFSLVFHLVDHSFLSLTYLER